MFHQSVGNLFTHLLCLGFPIVIYCVRPVLNLKNKDKTLLDEVVLYVDFNFSKLVFVEDYL